jgi:membrane protein implicated in regulation of membrane protease activity
LQADLFAGATFLTQAFNWNIYAAIVVLLAIAAMFTIAGKKYVHLYVKALGTRYKRVHRWTVIGYCAKTETAQFLIPVDAGKIF